MTKTIKIDENLVNYYWPTRGPVRKFKIKRRVATYYTVNTKCNDCTGTGRFLQTYCNAKSAFEMCSGCCTGYLRCGCVSKISRKLLK